MPPEPLALAVEPAPELPLDPPLLELPELPLDPPELALLEPEPPLDPPALELLELEPLAPPPLGDEAPELEEGVAGVGIEGVVGVLADGHPASKSKTPTKPIASRGRSLIGER